MSSVEFGEIFHSNGLFSPRTLTLSVTGLCNLDCSHCFVGAGSGGTGHAPEVHLLRLMDEFSGIGDGLRLTGGELLCHPSWRLLLRRAREKNFLRLMVQTNGTLMDDDAVSLLRELDFPGFHIQVSLDGASAATNDRVRGTGAFSAALAGLERLVKGGLASRVSVFFVEMRHNIRDIPELFRLADGLGIPSVVTGTVVSHGRARKSGEALPPEVSDYEELLEAYATDAGFREVYDRIGKVAALEWRREADPRSGCCTFVENPYVTPDGALYPCLLFHADPFAIKGVFGKSLRGALEEGVVLWSALRERSASRAARNEACRVCSARTVCGGGCMGRAWAATGDCLAVDDRCGIRRSVYVKNPHLNNS